MNSLEFPIYNLSGAEVDRITLDQSLFGVTANPQLLHQVIRTFLANGRNVVAHTKDRSDVAGSGKKPWRQKGTGNARVGSARSPLWRGGGITFGPTNERNYALRLPQKMRQSATRMALSQKASQGQLVIISSLDDVNGKTKSWLETVNKLPSTQGNVLVVDNKKTELAHRAIRNIPHYTYVTLEGLTIYDLMRYPILLITKDAVIALTAKLGQQSAPSATGETKQTSAMAAA